MRRSLLGESEVDVGEEVVAVVGFAERVDRADDDLVRDVRVRADRDRRLAGEVGGYPLQPLRAGVERRVVVVVVGGLGDGEAAPRAIATRSDVAAARLHAEAV